MINESERANKMNRVISYLNNEKYTNKSYSKYLSIIITLTVGLSGLYYIAFLILKFLAK